MAEVIDIGGQKFNRLTVIERVESTKKGTYWLCLCDCGNSKVIESRSIRKGITQSCGCLQKERAYENQVRFSGVLRGPRKNLVGEIRGRLTVVAQAANKDGRIMWLCLCVCGNEVTRSTGYINGAKYNKQSCGCWQKEDVTAQLLAYHATLEHGVRFIDYTGRRYGRLLVLRLHDTKINGRTTWVVRCDCGVEKTVSREGLDIGKTNSCGCFRREDSRKKMTKLKKTQVGDKNPSWNPNLTDEDRVDRRTLLPVKEWAKAVKVKDDYTCQCCGKKRGGLNSHHLDSYSAHPDRRVDIANGVTLCINCHKAFHKHYGNKVNFEWQFHEFKQSYLEA